VEAEKHNIKVEGKKKEFGDQGQGDGNEGYDSSKQLPDAHNNKGEFQDQLRASPPEAMPKNFPITNSHSRYSDFLQNLHDGDGFKTSRPLGHHWVGGSGQQWTTGFALSITQNLLLI
jgi:hypothetical protein